MLKSPFMICMFDVQDGCQNKREMIYYVIMLLFYQINVMIAV